MRQLCPMRNHTPIWIHWLLFLAITLLVLLAASLQLSPPESPARLTNLLPALATLFLGLGLASLCLILIAHRHETRRQTEHLQFHYETLSRQLAETQLLRRDVQNFTDSQKHFETLLSQQSSLLQLASQLHALGTLVQGLTHQIHESSASRTQLAEKLNSLDSAIMNARYELSRARTLHYPNRPARDEALSPLEQQLNKLEQERQDRDSRLDQLRLHVQSLTYQRDHALQYLHQTLSPHLPPAHETKKADPKVGP